MPPDITDLATEERQRALWAMTPAELQASLNKLMADSRQSEIQARLDALTVMILQVLAPPEDIASAKTA